MKRMVAAGVMLLGVGVAGAQEVVTAGAGVQGQQAALDAEWAALRLQVRGTAAVTTKLQAMQEAARAYEAAQEDIAEIKGINERLNAARAEVRDLLQRREQALRANAPGLEAARRARDAAAEEYRRALLGGEAGAALLARRRELAGGTGRGARPAASVASATATNAPAAR